MSVVPYGDEDPRNRPKPAQNTSERERECSIGRNPEYSPEEGRDNRGDPSGHAHTSGVPGRIEDVGKRPRKLRNASKHVRKRSERRNPEDSPSRPRVGPEDPGGETVAPGGVHIVQERPQGVRNERADGTDAPCQDTGPGGHLEVQGDSKGVEVDPDRHEVVEGAEHDGKRPKSEEDQRYVETNAQCRDRGPGGHRGGKERREASRTNGSAMAMAMESGWTGYGAGRMAQRAAQAATRNESIRDR